MFCSPANCERCGAAAPHRARFCPRCGTQLVGGGEAQAIVGTVGLVVGIVLILNALLLVLA